MDIDHVIRLIQTDCALLLPYENLISTNWALQSICLWSFCKLQSNSYRIKVIAQCGQVLSRKTSQLLHILLSFFEKTDQQEIFFRRSKFSSHWLSGRLSYASMVVIKLEILGFQDHIRNKITMTNIILVWNKAFTCYIAKKMNDL